MKLNDPSQLPRGPRRFIAYWLRDIAVGFDKRGFPSLLPLKFIICAAVGTVVGRFASPSLWTEMQNVIAFYAAGLAVSAILLAVCWAGFGRIFETLSDAEFGPWMRQQKLAGYYGFYIDWIQACQMAAVFFMAVGLLLSILEGIPLLASRIVLGVAVTSGTYAAWWAGDCVRIMQELGDYRAAYRASAGNVHAFAPKPGNGDSGKAGA